jgi:hypothetical protein
VISTDKLIYICNVFHLTGIKLLQLVPFCAHLPVQRRVNSDFILPILDFTISLVLRKGAPVFISSNGRIADDEYLLVSSA